MLDPVVTVSSVVLPLELSDVKAHLVAADFAEDDALIDVYLKAAVSRLDGQEGILGRAFMDQTVQQSFPRFANVMIVPMGPVTTVTTVDYYDENSATQTIAGHRLLKSCGKNFIEFDDGFDFPATATRSDAVTITYQAGYADAAAVPAAIKQAIRMMVAHWYETREDTAASGRDGAEALEVPLGSRALLAPYRKTDV